MRLPWTRTETPAPPQAPAVPIDKANFDRARDTWLHFFDTALLGMLDYEMRPEQLANQVALCAGVADAALDAYERRWSAVGEVQR